MEKSLISETFIYFYNEAKSANKMQKIGTSYMSAWITNKTTSAKSSTASTKQSAKIAQQPTKPVTIS